MSELPSKESLSAVDAAWLRMDSETNAMVIHSLLIFSEAPAFEKIQALVSERLLRHRRFRQHQNVSSRSWIMRIACCQ